MKVGDTIKFTGDDPYLSVLFQPSTGRECKVVKIHPIKSDGTFDVVVRINGDIQYTSSEYLE